MSTAGFLSKLGRVKHLCSGSKCSSLLIECAEINVYSDSRIHSKHMCNNCYAKMLKVNTGSVSHSLQPFPFTEHIDGCAMCTWVQMKPKGGRPKRLSEKVNITDTFGHVQGLRWL